MLQMRDWIVRGEPLFLGYVGEHLARKVAIALDGDYEGWAFKLDVRLPNGRAWALDLTRAESALSCTVERGLLTMPGDVMCTLRGIYGEVIRESNTFAAVIHDAVDAQDCLPPLPESEFAQMERAVTAAKEEALKAAKDARESSENAQKSAEESEKALSGVTGMLEQAEQTAERAETTAKRAEELAAEALRDAETIGRFVKDAESAAERAERAANEAADQTAERLTRQMQDYLSDAETARKGAETAQANAEQAANEAGQRAAEEAAGAVREELGELVTQSETAKEGAEAALEETRELVKQAGNMAGGGVTSFNRRNGAVMPQAGDYDVSQVTNAASKNDLKSLIQVGSSLLAVTLPSGGILFIEEDEEGGEEELIVLDQAEYDAMEVHPANTVYYIKG